MNYNDTTVKGIIFQTARRVINLRKHHTLYFQFKRFLLPQCNEVKYRFVTASISTGPKQPVAGRLGMAAEATIISRQRLCFKLPGK